MLHITHALSEGSNGEMYPQSWGDASAVVSPKMAHKV